MVVSVNSEQYYTIESEHIAEINIKGSRFVSIASPVHSREEAENFITKIAKKYFDATHNCFAYKVGFAADAAVFRYSDAGEPAGTAGLPIYTMIERNNLTDIAIVVNRYFGGTKLGIGGLIRAYTDVTKAVLAKAKIIARQVTTKLRLTFQYDRLGGVMQAIQKYKGKIIHTGYASDVELGVEMSLHAESHFRKVIQDVTAGQAAVEEWQ